MHSTINSIYLSPLFIKAYITQISDLCVFIVEKKPAKRGILRFAPPVTFEYSDNNSNPDDNDSNPDDNNSNPDDNDSNPDDNDQEEALDNDIEAPQSKVMNDTKDVVLPTNSSNDESRSSTDERSRKEVKVIERPRRDKKKRKVKAARFQEPGDSREDTLDTDAE